MTQYFSYDARQVLDFWSEVGSQKWFVKDVDFDTVIKNRFLDIHVALMKDECEHWMHNASDMLAAIIVLDQFSRNMFRDTPDAFASDDKALSYALVALKNSFDQTIEKDFTHLWLFFYLPFMHSEDIEMQKLCVKLIEARDNKLSLKFAQDHHDIIRDFGRFPHRNVILGRKNTPEEDEFMRDDNPRPNKF